MIYEECSVCECSTGNYVCLDCVDNINYYQQTLLKKMSSLIASLDTIADNIEELTGVLEENGFTLKKGKK